jgi:hypothetical protein
MKLNLVVGAGVSIGIFEHSVHEDDIMAEEAAKPLSRDEKIVALMGEYFWRCRLMYKTYRSRMRYYEPRYKAVKYNTKREEARAYFEMFIAMLYVTYEGFKDIGLADEHVDGLASQHIDDLRIARNGVFHYPPTNSKPRKFLACDPRRVRWAEELY